MIHTTPFHERTSALNETGLWQHWSGHLVVTRYQSSDKFEYFAVRNSAGIFDTSPLYKYRIAGRDAERFLEGMLARDIRTCPPGHAHYTTWLDERGFVLEDGVVQHRAPGEFLLTAAEPNFAWFADRVGRLDVTVEEVSLDIGALAIQGPRSRSSALRPMNGRSSSSRPLNIPAQPSSSGVDRCASLKAKRLELKSAPSSSSPASIRSMYSAPIPYGRMPQPSAASHRASQTVSASGVSTQIS